MSMAMIRHLALLFLGLGACQFATACTSYAIGRKATADGSVIVSQSEDADDLADPRMGYIPARDHAPGSMAPSYYTDGPSPRWVSNDLGPFYAPNEMFPNLTQPIGYIPQVPHTFAYWDSNYGIINEHNVGMGETTCSAMFHTCAKGDTRGCEPGRTAGEALLDVRMLTMFGMERATTARQAIQIMGDLAYKYGFYGTHDPNGDGESLMVGDPQEAWVFHILADPTGTKAIWAAVRVPDDSMTVASNMFTIREVNVNDTENCMASPNIYSVAQERGWWKPGEVLDFTRVYSNGEYGAKYYSGRRMWRTLSLAAPSLNLSPDYSDLRYDRKWPWAVKPDTLLTKEDVFRFYRDYYVGTQFDMTKGLAAGFGGTPDRFATPEKEVKGSWERTIALYRTGLVKVVQLQETTPQRPREVAGVAWCAPGPAHYTPFLPIPSGLSEPLSPLSWMNPKHYSKNAFNWAARKVMMTAQIRFDHMHPLVEEKQKEVEAAGNAIVAMASAQTELAETEPQHRHDKQITKFSKLFAEHVKDSQETWRELSDEMLIHFADNSDIARISTKPHDVGMDADTQSLSYPAWWLRAVDFEKGLGLAGIPVENQCPPVCLAEGEWSPGAVSVDLLAEGESRGGFMIVGFFAVVPGLLLVVAFVKRHSSHQGDKDIAYSPL